MPAWSGKRTAVRRNQTQPSVCRAANVPLRGVAPFPLVGLDRVASQQPPQGGIKRYLACRAGSATKGSTASSPESGAISHSRAAANVPQRGVAPFPLVGLDRVASQQPPESITARDWRLECGKARLIKYTSTTRLSGIQPDNRRIFQLPQNQERYRTAGRVLQARSDRSVLAYVTGGSSAARRAPAKRDRSVLKSAFGDVAQVAGNGDQFGKQFDVNDTGLSGTFTVFHPLDMIFFGF